MEHPLISILIPFKNTAPFLAECLNSIVMQTYEHWEVLAVDDHSNDESRSIVDTFAQKDSRIKVFTSMGQGIIEALRTAYGFGRGELVTRMDSDDVMEPHKLELLAGSLTKHGKGHLAIGLVRYFSDRGISNGYARYEVWLNGLTRLGTNYSEIYKECVIPSPCWLAYREDLEACGAFSPDRYPEDYDLCFRFYAKGLRCIPCQEVVHLWRDYDTRTSRTSEHYAQNYFLDIKLHYFLQLNFDPGRPLALWGAGYKGKTIAKALVEKGIPFHWLCDNPNKIGKKIYGVPLLHYSQLAALNKAQSMVTVANEGAQDMIKNHFSNLGYQPMKDYFFFC